MEKQEVWSLTGYDDIGTPHPNLTYVRSYNRRK